MKRQSSRRRNGQFGIAPEEVPEWQRDTYLTAIDSLTDSGAMPVSERDSQLERVGEFEMYGSVLSLSDSTTTTATGNDSTHAPGTPGAPGDHQATRGV